MFCGRAKIAATWVWGIRCNMPNDLKTDPDLIRRLEAAARHVLTRSEIHKQRVSFIYGNLPSDSPITRHQVEVAVAKIEGAPEAA